MLVSPLVPEVVAAVEGVVTGAFGGILWTLTVFYRDRGSDCVTEPCRKYYGGLVNGPGM